MKLSKGEKIGQIINVVILISISLSMLLPFYIVAITSITPEKEILMDGYKLWPDSFTFAAYQAIFSEGSTVFQAFKVTVFITVVGTLLSLAVTAMMAYAMSRRDMPGRNKIMAFVIFTMFFGPGLIPYAMLIKNLGLIDNILVLIIPGAFNAWHMILIRNYFLSLPTEMRESAEMDGAGEWTVFSRIILPLSKPIIATILLFTSVGAWGKWFEVAFFINDKKLYTLQYLLLQVLNRAQAVNDSSSNASAETIVMLSDSIKFATVMVTVIPILLVYPFVQKHFVKGVMIGSLKG